MFSVRVVVALILDLLKWTYMIDSVNNVSQEKSARVRAVTTDNEVWRSSYVSGCW